MGYKLGNGMKDIFNNEDYIKMLENIIETSHDGIYITDGQANTVLVNKSYERITGLKREDLLGRNMADLVDEGVMSESATLWIIKNKKPKTIYQKFSTGKSALVTSTPFFDEKGSIQFIVANVRDITELEALKEKYIQSTKENIKYRNLVEQLKMQIAKSEEIIAEDEEMLKLLVLAKRVAKVDATILIEGETGAGKDVLAKYIYNNSARADKPYIKINCGAIPETLIESEFFGYTDGAFTGAAKGGKSGIFEAANNGTLFLDEIGELPLNMQVKLLRVLQDGEIEKVGSNRTIKVDVRIIAATNRNLEEMVDKGLFRQDLYYRLNVVKLTVPPLRDRRSSIIPTVKYYLDVFNRRYGLNKTISKEALMYLYKYNWPGNVRELRNLIERLTVTSVGDVIDKEDLPDYIIFNNKDKSLGSCETMKLQEAIEKLERDMIFKAYKRHGNVRDAAKELGISAATFVRKRKKYL